MINREAEISELYSKLNSGNKFMSKRSIFALGEALDDGEPIKGVLACWYNSWTGALATTDRQIVFMQKPLLGRKTIERFPFELITSVEQSSFLGMADLIIHSGGKSAKVSQIDSRDVAPFIKAFDRARASKPRGQTENPLTADIEKLAALFDKGSLTEAEYSAAKARLLS